MAKAKKPANKSAPARGLTVDAYVQQVSGWQRTALADLRAIVKAAVPDAVETIKWGQPVYEVNGPMIYMRVATNHVTFGFWRGKQLAARGHAGLASGGKQMGHLKITDQPIDRPAIAALARDAAKLNREHGDPTRG